MHVADSQTAIKHKNIDPKINEITTDLNFITNFFNGILYLEWYFLKYAQSTEANPRIQDGISYFST